MTREIKFRAWDKEAQKMYQSEFVRNLGEWALEPNALMQFTGLKDKNGKDMYEGDIIKGIMGAGAGMQKKEGKECFWEVKYSVTHLFGGWYLKQITELTGDYRANPSNNEKVEVIGNIWENPELIK